MSIKVVIQLAASKQNRSKKEPTLNYFMLFEAVPEKVHSSRSAAYKGKLQASQWNQAKQTFAKSDWADTTSSMQVVPVARREEAAIFTASADHNS